VTHEDSVKLVCLLSVLHIGFALIDAVVDVLDEGVRHSRSGSLKARPPPPTAPKPCSVGSVKSTSRHSLNKLGMLAFLQYLL